VSGEPALTRSSATFPSGFVTEKNPFLDPETSTGFDLGGDARLRDGGLLSLDLSRTEIYNVFEDLTTPNAVPVKGQPIGLALIRPINAAELTARMVKVRYAKRPRLGLGYNATLALESSQVNGIPASFYLGVPTCQAGQTALCGVLPANGQQICGFGQATPGTPTCIPYLKGYAQVTYAFRDGSSAELGMDLEGKNNAYFQPPFVQFDLSLSNPVSPLLDVQVSVQNLLNTNNFYNLPAPGEGVTTVVGVQGGSLSQSPSYLIPAPPRTLRVQLNWHSARAHAQP
jgi:outer membrane receptor protein involved in Fe transport